MGLYEVDLGRSVRVALLMEKVSDETGQIEGHHARTSFLFWLIVCQTGWFVKSRGVSIRKAVVKTSCGPLQN